MLKQIIFLISFMMVCDVPAQDEFVQQWLILGTFPNKNTEDPLGTAFIESETSVLPARNISCQGRQWRIAETDKEGKVDFLEQGFEQKENVAVYTHIYLFSEKAQLAKIWLGSDDGIALFFNGALIFSNPVWRGWAPAQDILTLRLRKGWNRLLFKIVNGVGGFAFSARLTDQQGNPLTGIRYAFDNPIVKEHDLKKQSWLIGEDLCLDNHLVSEQEQFYLPYTIRLSDLGSQIVGETDIILTAVDSASQPVFEKKWNMTRSKNEDFKTRFDVRQLLLLLEKSSMFRIRLKWAGNQSETEIIVCGRTTFHAHHNPPGTSSSKMISRKNVTDFLNPSSTGTMISSCSMLSTKS